jgi:hypothetical protein
MELALVDAAVSIISSSPQHTSVCRCYCLLFAAEKQIERKSTQFIQGPMMNKKKDENLNLRV